MLFHFSKIQNQNQMNSYQFEYMTQSLPYGSILTKQETGFLFYLEPTATPITQNRHEPFADFIQRITLTIQTKTNDTTPA